MGHKGFNKILKVSLDILSDRNTFYTTACLGLGLASLRQFQRHDTKKYQTTFDKIFIII